MIGSAPRNLFARMIDDQAAHNKLGHVNTNRYPGSRCRVQPANCCKGQRIMRGMFTSATTRLFAGLELVSEPGVGLQTASGTQHVLMHPRRNTSNASRTRLC